MVHKAFLASDMPMDKAMGKDLRRTGTISGHLRAASELHDVRSTVRIDDPIYTHVEQTQPQHRVAKLFVARSWSL